MSNPNQIDGNSGKLSDLSKEPTFITTVLAFYWIVHCEFTSECHSKKTDGKIVFALNELSIMYSYWMGVNWNRDSHSPPPFLIYVERLKENYDKNLSFEWDHLYDNQSSKWERRNLWYHNIAYDLNSWEIISITFDVSSGYTLFNPVIAVLKSKVLTGKVVVVEVVVVMILICITRDAGCMNT